eukprot:scaffold574_cov246-Pinguiococcus_pyrenoidosus.AAC.19
MGHQQIYQLRLLPAGLPRDVAPVGGREKGMRSAAKLLSGQGLASVRSSRARMALARALALASTSASTSTSTSTSAVASCGAPDGASFPPVADSTGIGCDNVDAIVFTLGQTTNSCTHKRHASESSDPLQEGHEGTCKRASSRAAMNSDFSRRARVLTPRLASSFVEFVRGRAKIRDATWETGHQATLAPL